MNVLEVRDLRVTYGHVEAVRAISFAEAANRSARGRALGRWAADAGDRARPSGAAANPPARRAVDGPRADPGAADLRDRPRDPPRRHDHPAGGAEREDGSTSIA